MKTKLFMAEGRLEPVRFAEIVFTASGMISEVLVEELERTCEIGVMRAIGASNRDIQGIVIIEGLVIGLISWTVAILIAILTAPACRLQNKWNCCLAGFHAFPCHYRKCLPRAKSLTTDRERYIGVRIIDDSERYEHETRSNWNTMRISLDLTARNHHEFQNATLSI